MFNIIHRRREAKMLRQAHRLNEGFNLWTALEAKNLDVPEYVEAEMQLEREFPGLAEIIREVKDHCAEVQHEELLEKLARIQGRIESGELTPEQLERTRGILGEIHASIHAAALR